MFEWMKRKIPFMGSVLYRGSSPMRAEEFGFLADKGIRVSEAPTMLDCHWSMMMEHPKWGQAKLSCPKREEEIPLRFLFDVSRMLTADEKQTAQAYGMQMTIHMEGKEANLLRDRKNALRFLRAVMDDDGLAAVDYLSMGVWSAAALDEELSHDADLDIEHIYGVHKIVEADRGKPIWFHTHGLGEIGFFDFDIVNPHEGLSANVDDIFRSIAFAIVEKKVSPSTARFRVYSPGGSVRFVAVEEFNAQAEAKYAVMRDGGEETGHNRDRAVLCDPVSSSSGLVSGGKIRPARAIISPIHDNILIDFSASASQLMAERAKNTYGSLRRIAGEFEEIGFPILVKLAYVVDGGGKNDKEHLWFSVNEFFDDKIDCTLKNEPYQIARMKIGDRGRRSVTLISDWVIMTPLGPINPRSSKVVRAFRQNSDLLDKIRRAMKDKQDK